MKHIRKYRLKLSRREQEKIRSKARGRAKQILSTKYKKEYIKLSRYFYNKIRRETLKDVR
jgi:hypothetical protein